MTLDRWLAPRRMALVAIVVGLSMLAGAQVFFSGGRLAVTNPSLHVGLDVVEGMIALLIAYLMVGRVRDRRRLSEVLCVFALVVLGLSKVVLLGIPTVAAGTRGDLQVWAAPVGRIIGSSALALAALTHGKRVGVPSQALQLASAAGTVTVFVLATASRAFQSTAPQDPSDPSVQWLHFLTALALAVASVGFVRRASRTGDEMFGWFGAGCALGAIARLGYLAFPSQGFDDVYIQDFLRLGFYVLLLVGAQRELTSYWHSRAIASALDERRRVARDLHDGIAQELVFISGLARRVERGSEDPVKAAPQLASSADRALFEARRAISILTTRVEEPLHDALLNMTEEMQARTDIPIRFEGDTSVDLDPSDREEALRIAREAVNNAVKHSRAKTIELRTGRDPMPFIEVVDDGIGMSPGGSSSGSGGFGLISMKERATVIGATIEIGPGVNTGVRVRLVLPSNAS